MKTEEEFRSAMASVITKVQNHPDRIKDFKEELGKIAAFCKKIRIVQESEDEARERYSDFTAVNLWSEMVVKVAKAPTQIHAMVCAKILVPLIYEKLEDDE